MMNLHQTNKKSTAAALFAVMALLPRGRAFSTPGLMTRGIAQESKKMPRSVSSLGSLNKVKSTRPTVALRAGSDDADAAKASLDQALADSNLRKATSILKNGNQGGKAELSREQWNQIFELIQERTANAEENTVENVNQATEFPTQSAARSEMTEMYKVLKESGQLQLFGALNTKMPLAAGSTNVPPLLLEGILDLPMTALTPKPTNSLLFAGVAVAILEGLISASLNIPLNNLVLSTLLLVSLDRFALNGATFETILKLFSPGVQNKILRHEAGHFLAAYLLGCPVEGIVLSAWAALKDKRFGQRQISAGTSFFDPELSQQINKRQAVTRSAVDRYSIIVMAGIAAEADNYGIADGGAGDEMALVAFLSQLNANSAKTGWNSDTIRNQARWGALQAVLALREYKPAYDALVDALEHGGTLGDCIFAIEKAARKHGLGPVKHPLGFIVEEQDEDSLMVQKVVWKKYKEQLDEAAAVAEEQSASSLSAPLFVDKSKSQSLENIVKNPPQKQPEPVNEEEMAVALQQYRAQVEEKLRDVEQKLEELN
mmetsp:Transcript_16372/g.21428  ORF Transcript_16372/g.21428 Transcript_16372/m.21428 type:complete len:545 (-) Transcript_16372:216-1850(-)|eukprot:CAMPEP_0198148690 /NCGR_PEP_ID=MMETSP1443-20131203/42758_1 /TAXON_ID=186043 /ORGANISM="Entomoneis sp., Strain CCMP2396" /LENGTH=544 /DNA_ID=CAMNT_0043813447 /DNA_START=264 /DNA_END=1898 /DNA_ORIENTATION=+